MKKIIRLSESDLYKMVAKAKRGIYEAAPEPEPVPTDESDTCSASFLFGEGETQFKPEISNQAKEFIKGCIDNDGGQGDVHINFIEETISIDGGINYEEEVTNKIDYLASFK